MHNDAQFQHNDTFWKHCEKEKLLVMSNFSFTHSVFYPFGELSAIFVKFKILVCRLFQFGPAWNLSSGNGLIWQQSFSLVEMVQFLAPLAVGQRAYVMVCCPSVRPSVHPCVNFFFKHLLRWNYLSDFDEISQKCSHHGPLQNFLK